MARRGFLAEWRHQTRLAEREAAKEQRAAEREYKAMVLAEEKARKNEERLQTQLQRAQAAEQKRLEKEAKAAHIDAMQAQVDMLNSELAKTVDEMNNILQSTLNVDDYIDLEALRRDAATTPSDGPELYLRTPEVERIEDPARPRGKMPSPPSGLSGIFGKKKYEKEVALAKKSLRQSLEEWQWICDKNQRIRQQLQKEFEESEFRRRAALHRAKQAHEADCNDLAAKIDSLIAGLDVRDPEAIAEYVGLVIENSVYPEDFQINRRADFDGSIAELNLKVLIPSPDCFPTVKLYRYVKSSDSISNTSLSEKAKRDLYAYVVNQVAIRSVHENFEADKRGQIRTISLEVGTHSTDPATGIEQDFTFVAVGAERDSFLRFDLSAIDLEATLGHLGASVSKNPYELLAAEVSGVRKSNVESRSPIQFSTTSDMDLPEAGIETKMNLHQSGENLDELVERLTEENRRLRLQLSAEGESDVVNLDDEQVLQSVGIYNYHHPLETAVEYQSMLSQITSTKKLLVKSGNAIETSNSFMYDNSLAKGAKMCRDLGALMLLAYNSQADSVVKTLRAGAVSTAKKRLEKTRDTIAKRGRMMDMHVSEDFHSLQLEELELTADFLAKKEEEKEQKREERERLREERAAERELAAAKAKLEKERDHILEALQHAKAGEVEFDRELEIKLEELEEAIVHNDYRLANVKAGYVYVISNHGALGKGIIKIGMTRRLDPMDRVNELGDASVPFKFDVHCLYFSENAVQLESELHDYFADRRLNHVNTRREFFFATPEEVREVFFAKVGKLIEYNEHAECPEYHQSVKYWPVDSARYRGDMRLVGV